MREVQCPDQIAGPVKAAEFGEGCGVVQHHLVAPATATVFPSGLTSRSSAERVPDDARTGLRTIRQRDSVGRHRQVFGGRGQRDRPHGLPRRHVDLDQRRLLGADVEQPAVGAEGDREGRHRLYADNRLVQVVDIPRDQGGVAEVLLRRCLVHTWPGPGHRRCRQRRSRQPVSLDAVSWRYVSADNWGSATAADGWVDSPPSPTYPGPPATAAGHRLGTASSTLVRGRNPSFRACRCDTTCCRCHRTRRAASDRPG